MTDYSKKSMLDIFRSTGALLEGHFVLTSGKHSPTYFQCARVLQHPEYLTRFGAMIAEQFKREPVDVVISPAVGGIVIGTEVGRQLGVRTIFTERKNGQMTLRRGFSLQNGERVLVVEDVITTGGSVQEVISLLERFNVEIVGIGVVVDRSGGTAKLHARQFSILEHLAVNYDPDEIPDKLRQIPPQKPGSKGLQ